MTPAALLVCMTIVTNVNHGSVATNACHYEQPAVAMATEDPITTAAIDTVKVPVAETKALAVVAVAAEAKPARPATWKHSPRTAQVYHRAPAQAARPAMTAAQDAAYRHAWFKRLADM